MITLTVGFPSASLRTLYKPLTPSLRLPFYAQPGESEFAAKIVCARSENLQADQSPAKTSPIEFLTENGFSIVRQWEAEQKPPPADGVYAFIVRSPTGEERQIIVSIAADVFAQAQNRTRWRIQPGNAFWIFCAERHLANHVWENDDFPPNDKIRIEELDREDLLSALRWERS